MMRCLAKLPILWCLLTVVGPAILLADKPIQAEVVSTGAVQDEGEEDESVAEIPVEPVKAEAEDATDETSELERPPASGGQPAEEKAPQADTPCAETGSAKPADDDGGCGGETGSAAARTADAVCQCECRGRRSVVSVPYYYQVAVPRRHHRRRVRVVWRVGYRSESVAICPCCGLATESPTDDAHDATQPIGMEDEPQPEAATTP